MGSGGKEMRTAASAFFLSLLSFSLLETRSSVYFPSLLLRPPLPPRRRRYSPRFFDAFKGSQVPVTKSSLSLSPSHRKSSRGGSIDSLADVKRWPNEIISPRSWSFGADFFTDSFRSNSKEEEAGRGRIKERLVGWTRVPQAHPVYRASRYHEAHAMIQKEWLTLIERSGDTAVFTLPRRITQSVLEWNTDGGGGQSSEFPRFSLSLCLFLPWNANWTKFERSNAVSAVR